jgi:hypothetical protein
MVVVIFEASPRFGISNSWEMVQVVGGEVRRNSLRGHAILQDMYIPV